MDAIRHTESRLCIDAGDIANSKPSTTVVTMQVQEIHNVVSTEDVVPSPIPRAASHLPPERRTKNALGIDAGSARVRFGVFSKDDPSSALESHAFDSVVSVTESGEMVVGEPPRINPNSIHMVDDDRRTVKGPGDRIGDP
jgi:hypothetical protein